MLTRYRPDAEDADLLIAVARDLADGKYPHKLPPVIRTLGRLRDPATEALLRELAEDEDDEEPHVTAALARRGDAKAMRRLVDLSIEHRTALALFLEIRPREALDRIAARLSDPETSLDCAFRIDFSDSMWSVRFAGVRWPEEAFLGLESALAAAPPPASVLGKIAVEVPFCRTRRLGALLLAAQSPGEAPTWWEGPTSAADRPKDEREDDRDEEHWIGNPDEIAALLFSLDPARTRELLRGWARHEVPVIRTWARRAFVRAGDPTRGKEILAWKNEHEFMSMLLRSDCPEVREHLRDLALEPKNDGNWPTEALRCYARLLGWPVHLPFPDPEDASTPIPCRKPLLEGRLADALAASPWTARLADPKSNPDRTDVWERIGRRALAGDPKARAEFWSALRCGRYRWFHGDFEEPVHTLGRDPSVLPHWVADLDSNCCRISDGMAYGVFGTPFFEPAGWDEHSIYTVASEGIGRPPSHHVLDLFRYTGGEWMWSPILDSWHDGLERASRASMIPVPE